jgi:hypothetical protein
LHTLTIFFSSSGSFFELSSPASSAFALAAAFVVFAFLEAGLTWGSASSSSSSSESSRARLAPDLGFSVDAFRFDFGLLTGFDVAVEVAAGAVLGASTDAEDAAALTRALDLVGAADLSLEAFLRGGIIQWVQCSARREDRFDRRQHGGSIISMNCSGAAIPKKAVLET